jgi:hypothetical protein
MPSHLDSSHGWLAQALRVLPVAVLEHAQVAEGEAAAAPGKCCRSRGDGVTPADLAALLTWLPVVGAALLVLVLTVAVCVAAARGRM